MEFEFDPEKSLANKEKHGIDFEEAQRLWDDPDRVEVPARTADEPRIMTMGTIRSKLWSAVVTLRGEKTRIISVRRSNKSEAILYES